MKHPNPALRILAVVCLLLVAACQERHEPMKPTTLVTAAR